MTELKDIQIKLEGIRKAALDALAGADSDDAMQAWRVTHLGRSSALMGIFSALGGLSKEDRPLVGQAANAVKVALESAMTERADAIRTAALQALESQRLDITLPGRQPVRGHLHPQTRTLRQIIHIFAEMGFQVYRSREVESDELNFELLNIPAHHPARDMGDTFHTTTPGAILRTHTSPGQIHVMRELAPEPIRAILPGMVYRYEQADASHEIQFNQLEVLAVGRGITFADLKGTLEDFAKRMFGQNVRTRLRPSYFPFTEPSAELNVECFVCGGKGCGVCKGGGWLEILGCGMVHPTVLRNGGYDPAIYSGFAAGMGPERISMLRNCISDIRYFWGGDVRFLEQF